VYEETKQKAEENLQNQKANRFSLIASFISGCLSFLFIDPNTSNVNDRTTSIFDR